MTAPSIVVRNAEVDGRIADVHIVNDRIESVGDRVGGADLEHDAEGGAVIPGLHDHHIHLLALAAARVLDLGRARRRPLGVRRRDSWRGDDVAPGRLASRRRLPRVDDGRARPGPLDALVPTTPVRVQHATGALWVLNSAGVAGGRRGRARRRGCRARQRPAG